MPFPLKLISKLRRWPGWNHLEIIDDLIQDAALEIWEEFGPEAENVHPNLILGYVRTSARRSTSRWRALKTVAYAPEFDPPAEEPEPMPDFDLLPQTQQILWLKTRGFTVPEICAKLHLDRIQVRKGLKQARIELGLKKAA